MEYPNDNVEYKVLEIQICSLPGVEYRRWLRYTTKAKREGRIRLFPGSKIRADVLVVMREFVQTLRVDYKAG